MLGMASEGNTCSPEGVPHSADDSSVSDSVPLVCQRMGCDLVYTGCRAAVGHARHHLLHRQVVGRGGHLLVLALVRREVERRTTLPAYGHQKHVAICLMGASMWIRQNGVLHSLHVGINCISLESSFDGSHRGCDVKQIAHTPLDALHFTSNNHQSCLLTVMRS